MAHPPRGQCVNLDAATVANPSCPVIEVCGTGIKVTVFLRNRCESYYEYQKVVGTCNTGASSSSCVTVSPGDDPMMGAYQSYLIEQC
eukprot:scaffold124787_cov23-Cyclotella_meneghiniana.AAC.2